MKAVEFYRHSLTEADIAEVSEVLRSVFLTTGPRAGRFEKMFAEYLGVSEVVSVSSCTSALFLSLAALNVREGDEVITTPLTFIATANAVLHHGATPVFVDVEPTTGNIDAARVRDAITDRTRAIVPVHLYGAMADVRALGRDRFGGERSGHRGCRACHGGDARQHQARANQLCLMLQFLRYQEPDVWRRWRDRDQ